MLDSHIAFQRGLLDRTSAKVPSIHHTRDSCLKGSRYLNAFCTTWWDVCQKCKFNQQSAI